MSGITSVLPWHTMPTCRGGKEMVIFKRKQTNKRHYFPLLKKKTEKASHFEMIQQVFADCVRRADHHLWHVLVREKDGWCSSHHGDAEEETVCSPLGLQDLGLTAGRRFYVTVFTSGFLFGTPSERDATGGVTESRCSLYRVSAFELTRQARTLSVLSWMFMMG